MPLDNPSSAHRPVVGPLVQCVALPEFDDADLESVRGAFQAATACPLGQAWQSEPSSGFAPAEVRVGWRGASLLVFAEMTDGDIHTSATVLNQRMWELGDAFEIFLRAKGRDAYVEFQVAPNNQRLQLRYANRTALDHARATGDLAGALIEGDVFRSRTWIRMQHSRWNVFVEIPATSVCDSRDLLAGSRWHFSFSRYDHTRGLGEPVISSTSPHSEADFHRQQEWGVLTFSSQF